MANVKKEIEVDAPVSAAYNMWTDFEQFPQFMGHVREVRRTGPDDLHWKAEIAGTEVEWDAHITQKEPNRRVAWKARGESGQNGEVRFHEVGPNRTRIEVDFDYHLESRLKETLGSVFRFDDRAVKEDLERFKDLVEGRPVG